MRPAPRLEAITPDISAAYYSPPPTAAAATAATATAGIDNRLGSREATRYAATPSSTTATGSLAWGEGQGDQGQVAITSKA
jgi:hypothetical protein